LALRYPSILKPPFGGLTGDSCEKAGFTSEASSVKIIIAKQLPMTEIVDLVLIVLIIVVLKFNSCW
jgi:hypothetical protein